ncbi:MAG: hypothetical protein J0H39_03135 [Alphaproteobacteria bacterium]|nr:hypothetical protein [Alphaproteobacteria bacterium]
MRRFVLPILLLASLAACSGARQSQPARTATEQLLIANAADKAAERLVLAFEPGAKVFVDAANFDGVDSKYAIAAIRERMLKLGAHLAASRDDADTVVEIRAGALSMDDGHTLVGIPAFDIPIPLAGSSVKFPEIALFKRARRQGVAQFAATGYDAKTGAYRGSTGPQSGVANELEWTMLLFITWSRSDVEVKDDSALIERPEISVR